MKINFNQPLKSFNGTDVTDENNRPVWASTLIASILFNSKDISGIPLSPDQKFMAYNLSMKIANSKGTMEVSTEEAAFIKSVAGDKLASGVYGIIRNIIENNQ